MPSPRRGLLLWLALLAVAGCRRESRALAAARDGVLLLGNGAEPKELDPGQMAAEIEYNIDTALFEGLVNIANDGETILPGVAERWDISPDGKTYTFHLRPDAEWSDGSPVTADDFEFAFRRAFTPSLLSQTNIYGFPIVGAEEMMEGRKAALGARALDARTFQLRLKFPAPYILYVVAGAPFDPVPRAVVEKFGRPFEPGSAWSRPGNLVSNGAFMLKEWRPNEVVVAVRNPHYWDRDRIRLKEVRFFPTDDVDSEERSYRAGDLQVTYRLPPSKIAAYVQRHDPALRITAQLDGLYLMMNTRVPVLADVRVRRAFSLAIDRDRIVPLVTHGGDSPAHSLTRPGTAGYTPPPVVDFDPAEARRLLAAAGYPGGAGFPQLTLTTSDGLTELIEPLQDAWQRVLGIHVAIRVEEQKVFFDDLTATHYQIAYSGYFYGIQAPETALMVCLRDSPANSTGWSSPEFEAEFQKANNALDLATRRAAYDRMERIVQQTAAFIPIAFANQAHLVSPMVKGWRENALYAIDWRELWLAP